MLSNVSFNTNLNSSVCWSGPNTSTGNSTEFIDIYLAEGLIPGKSRLDSEEFLDVFAAPLEQLLHWIESGEITDVKTTISAYWLDRYRRGLIKPQALPEAI